MQQRTHSLVKKSTRLKNLLQAASKPNGIDHKHSLPGKVQLGALRTGKHARLASNPTILKDTNFLDRKLNGSQHDLPVTSKVLHSRLKKVAPLSLQASFCDLKFGDSVAVLSPTKRLPAVASLATLTGASGSLDSRPGKDAILDSNGEVTQKIQLSLKMIDLALQKFAASDLEGLVIVLDEVEHACLTYQARILISGFYQLYSSVLLDLGEYVKCVQTAKRLITDAEKQEDYSSMLFCYETAGQALTKLKYFEEALKCYFMMLKVSLKVHNLNKELLAYDKIGFGYFHLNEMDKSEYFHCRMVEGKTEPADSKLRNLQFNKQRVTQLELAMKTKPNSLDLVPDEDLNDLVSIFFEPMAVDPKYREMDEKKRNALMPTELFQQSNRRVGNVKVYSNDSSLQNLYKSSTSRKPTNRPQATLAHLSANRSVGIFDAVSAQSSKHHFRFTKFGRDLKTTNRKRIKQALMEYKELLHHASTKVVNVTNFMLSKQSVGGISSMGVAFKQMGRMLN